MKLPVRIERSNNHPRNCDIMAVLHSRS